MLEFREKVLIGFVYLFYGLTSQVNNYGHVEIVS